MRNGCSLLCRCTWFLFAILCQGQGNDSCRVGDYCSFGCGRRIWQSPTVMVRIQRDRNGCDSSSSRIGEPCPSKRGREPSFSTMYCFVFLILYPHSKWQMGYETLGFNRGTDGTNENPSRTNNVRYAVADNKHFSHVLISIYVSANDNDYLTCDIFVLNRDLHFRPTTRPGLIRDFIILLLSAEVITNVDIHVSCA